MPPEPETELGDIESRAQSESTEPPEVPLDAQMDIPPEGTGDETEEITKAAEFNRFMDWLKLSFAIWIVVGAAIVVVTLSVIQFYTQNDLVDGTSLDSAVDWSKGLAAIALGFAFGRALEDKKPSKEK